MRRHHLLLWPALVACVIGLAACSDDAAAPTGLDSGSTTTSTAGDPPTEDPGPGPEQALADAIASLGTSYDFDSVLSTEAGDLVAVRGSRVGASLEYSVEAAGAVVEVVVVDGAAWIRQDGSDEWLPSGDNPAGDPLTALINPVSIVADRDDPAVLLATYTGEAIGLQSADPVDVKITMTGTSMTFESAAGPGHLVTTLTRIHQPEPIFSPTE